MSTSCSAKSNYLDHIVSYCGYYGGHNYVFGPRTIQSNVIQRLAGESCLKLHNGIEVEMTIEGESVKIKMQEGRTQRTYFIETKGSRAPNAACEGVDFTFNKIKYRSSVMTIQVKIYSSKMRGYYDPKRNL